MSPNGCLAGRETALGQDFAARGSQSAIAHVEHPYVIAQRVTRFANVVGRENVIAGTDCGFAQASAVARQQPSIVWAKLESLTEGARIAWREKVRVQLSQGVSELIVL
jgi:hypothetical protein